ncbi:MAG: hypothetical protein KIT58_15965 [Planctomycetota bacterium]|nr:hypothetical protein [Planctomycetota bacterium]
MKSQWWFASDQFSAGLSPLGSTTRAGGGDWHFRDAQRLSITMEGTWVRDNHDGFLAGDNDVVVASRHRAGSGPIVDKLHFYAQEVPERTWIGGFFHPLIYGSTDFREASVQEITLELRVFDEDSLSGSESKALEGVIAAGTLAVAVAYPVFAPFAGLAGGLGRSLVHLVERLNEHDRIVEGRIRLAVNKPADQGWDLLQPGFLVCFAEELDASALFLGHDKRVYGGAPGRAVLYEHHSYAVVRVTRDPLNTPDWLIDQRAATLLSELEQGKRTNHGHALGFLRQTFDAYTSLQKLRRLQELTHKPDRTPDEERRLLELRADPALAEHHNGGPVADAGRRDAR